VASSGQMGKEGRNGGVGKAKWEAPRSQYLPPTAPSVASFKTSRLMGQKNEGGVENPHEGREL